jgi:hypothetical protein
VKQLQFKDVAAGDTLEAVSVAITTTDVVSGALASRDYSPLHHDYHYATGQAGHRDIFLNTPHQAALLEKFLGAWAGPRGRLARMRFSMKASLYAGDSIDIGGQVVDTCLDEVDCGWVDLKLWIDVGGSTATECEARLALPRDEQDNPWLRKEEAWRP